MFYLSRIADKINNGNEIIKNPGRGYCLYWFIAALDYLSIFRDLFINKENRKMNLPAPRGGVS
jgi:hypothetical protein